MFRFFYTFVLQLLKAVLTYEKLKTQFWFIYFSVIN